MIEDEQHAEWQGEYATLAEARAELDRRAALPWDHAPNKCPCVNWRGCGRRYEVVEYDDAARPWRELRRTRVLAVSAAGVDWVLE